MGAVTGITSADLAAPADLDGVAAVDLGSNSFHLIVARVRDGHLIATERLKEKVQLAKGQRDGRLADAAVHRGLDCIARFAQRLRGVPRERISVAGTFALREATNRDAFVPQAERLLGRPIRILSGREEAELIFLGVSHALAADTDSWLVIDVGGGSTELCHGRAFTPDRIESVKLGCVSLTDRWFGEGGFSARAYHAARDDALRSLAGVRAAFAHARAGRVIGTSGTIESVQAVLNAAGFASGAITRPGCDELERAFLERRWMVESGIPGLAPERIDIFPAGLAVVSALLEALDIEAIGHVDATLLDGLLYDLVGRRGAEDVRELTVSQWRARFEVDVQQIARVKATALSLHDGVAEPWRLDDERSRELLRWSCDLHEIGLLVSARQPNRHGAYLIENGDLAGFSSDDRRALALLVRAHRGGFPLFALASFDSAFAEQLKRLAILLRVAVILERSRTDADSPSVVARATGDAEIMLEIDSAWLSDHALSRAELERETDRVGDAGVRLVVLSR